MAPLGTLVRALGDPARYPHPADAIAVIETHISVVVLAGAFAYKFKKPVNLGFLDFSSLDARRRACENELRLNRRTAPGLYLDVVAVSGTPDAPVLGGSGPPIEYAVKMRRFADGALLAQMARAGTLGPLQIDATAAMAAAFHAGLPAASADSAFGSPAEILAPALQNFDQMQPLARTPAHRGRLEALRQWTVREHAARAVLIERRKRERFVRECHGDLHLGNIAWLEDRPVAFDCIEFNDAFRWTDVMSEVAFLVMDLADHRLPGLAWRFLDGYLARTGDYGGVGVLRYYLVYRALVRAKVALLRTAQSGTLAADALPAFEEYLALAERLAQPATAAIVITHGLSGSGKSTMAAQVTEAAGAIRVRSDVERKRLFGLDPFASSRPPAEQALYGADATQRTYERLARIAADVVAAGWPVIVDAAFLRHHERAQFRSLAAELGVPFAILSCTAPAAVLEARVRERARAAADPSDADEAVLASQRQWAEPLSSDESACAAVVENAGVGPAPGALPGELLARLHLAPPPYEGPMASGMLGDQAPPAG